MLQSEKRHGEFVLRPNLFSAWIWSDSIHLVAINWVLIKHICNEHFLNHRQALCEEGIWMNKYMHVGLYYRHSLMDIRVWTLSHSFFILGTKLLSHESWFDSSSFQPNKKSLLVEHKMFHFWIVMCFRKKKKNDITPTKFFF